MNRRALPAGVRPIIDRLDLQMRLASSYCGIGMDIYTRCEVNCTGYLTFRASGSPPPLGPYPVRPPHDPIFLSLKDSVAGRALSRSGLLQLIERVGEAAGIKGMKVSPHVFRHSTAIQLLRNGCDVYSLMGHTSLTVCQNYLKLSKLDLENQYRRCSPVDSLVRRKAV